jgi:hypothetical protein
MTNEQDFQTLRPASRLARAISLLLLVFIVYGTTVEAAHTHGTVTRSASATSSANLSSPASGVTSGTSLVSCGDCLICQLHQQFSTSVIAAPPTLNPPVLFSRHFKQTAVVIHSRPTVIGSGRAPPLSL